MAFFTAASKADFQHQLQAALAQVPALLAVEPDIQR